MKITSSLKMVLNLELEMFFILIIFKNKIQTFCDYENFPKYNTRLELLSFQKFQKPRIGNY